jgi:putative phosphoribosyl transferase
MKDNFSVAPAIVNAERPGGSARFADRQKAGRLLASLLTVYSRRDDVLIMAIPRGGVPVALELAEALSLTVAVLVVEKVRIPVHEAWQPSQSIGAVSSGGVRVLDPNRIRSLQIDAGEVERATTLAQNDQIHKKEIYERLHASIRLRGKTVLLVDDAVDSGATMQAAVQAVRAEQPIKIVVAAPVGSAGACHRLRVLTDEVVCPVQPPSGTAIHDCYAGFPTITDTEAYEMLQHHPLVR